MLVLHAVLPDEAELPAVPSRSYPTVHEAGPANSYSPAGGTLLFQHDRPDPGRSASRAGHHLPDRVGEHLSADVRHARRLSRVLPAVPARTEGQPVRDDAVLRGADLGDAPLRLARVVELHTDRVLSGPSAANAARTAVHRRNQRARHEHLAGLRLLLLHLVPIGADGHVLSSTL
uniref:(northern house mosquito) hypothetical protein n=1 Tax=Culex pipiens TaxID=7175 RepID=A0A8D8N0H8_CULPI